MKKKKLSYYENLNENKAAEHMKLASTLFLLKGDLEELFPADAYPTIGVKCQNINKNIYQNMWFHDLMENRSQYDEKMYQQYFQTKGESEDDKGD